MAGFVLPNGESSPKVLGVPNALRLRALQPGVLRTQNLGASDRWRMLGWDRPKISVWCRWKVTVKAKHDTCLWFQKMIPNYNWGSRIHWYQFSACWGRWPQVLFLDVFNKGGIFMDSTMNHQETSKIQGGTASTQQSVWISVSGMNLILYNMWIQYSTNLQYL